MSEDRAVGAVILAAGASRRYGSPKQLLMVEGRTLLEYAIEAAVTAGLAPIVAVVPVWLSRPARLDDPRLHWIRNAFPERGMSLSLRLGLETVGAGVSAVVILLGDQLRLLPETITGLLAARGERPVVACTADGILAPPVLIERSHFHLAEGPSGDIGLRQILLDHPDLVRAVEVGGHPPDIDTPEDFGRIGGP